MPSYRLGDDVDDFCIKCKRITNHSIVSVLNEEPAKVRCRTCYNDHDFRRCEIPPSKKDLKKAALLQEVLAAGGPAPAAAAASPTDPPPGEDSSPDVEAEAEAEEDTDAAPESAVTASEEEAPADGDAAKARKGGRKTKGAI